VRPLVLLGLCALLHADQYPRQPGIDVQHYVFKVTLSDDTDEIEGETTISVRFVQEGVRHLSFDFGSAMKVAEPPRKEGEKVDFLLDSAPKMDEIRRFSIRYRGKPAGGLKIVTNKFGDRCFFSANWPDLAHQWLPTVDHPYDKATGEFLITAPSKYQVVANGALVETLDLPGGKRLTHWKQSIPIATWLFNIGVAPFAVRHLGNSLETWVFPQDREAGIATFDEAARRAMDFFTSHIGPYPYEKLAHVQAAGMGGGMEHASEIFYGEKVVTGHPAYGLVAHESAHQWFGDSVTEKDWDDVWLSEGFATYFAALTAEHYEGRDAFVATMRRSRETALASETRLPDVAVVQAKEWKGIPNGIVYQKGGWALHMLRAQVGMPKFWDGIRLYYKRFRDGNASTADFRQVMEEASGQDLGWWFQQWLYRPGSPKIEGSWTYQSGKILIDIAQTQPGEPFRLKFQSLGIEMTQKQQHFEIPAAQPPASLDLDPDTWILADFSRWEPRARR
jgi:aminopeptidase N